MFGTPSNHRRVKKMVSSPVLGGTLNRNLKNTAAAYFERKDGTDGLKKEDFEKQEVLLRIQRGLRSETEKKMRTA